MKLVIQQHKLIKILNVSRPIVSKGNEDQSPLAHHILVTLHPEENKVVFLAGDKEQLNHYTTVQLEPEANEYCELGANGMQSFSIACPRLIDSIGGLPKDKLITIDAKEISFDDEQMSFADVTYDTTAVRIQASSGRGYPKFSDLDKFKNQATLTISERILSDLIRSTYFCVSTKGFLHKAFTNLTFLLSKNKLDVVGADVTRIGYCTYNFNSDIFDFSKCENSSVNESSQLVISLSKPSASVLLSSLSNEEKAINLQLFITESGNVKMLQIDRENQTFVFNLSQTKLPNISEIIPKNIDNDVLVKASELRDQIGRVGKFGEIVSIRVDKEIGLQLTSKDATSGRSQEYFSTTISPVEVNKDKIEVRCLAAHFSEIFTPLFESKRARDHVLKATDQAADTGADLLLSLNYIEVKLPMFLITEVDNTEIQRLYILTPYTTI